METRGQGKGVHVSKGPFFAVRTKTSSSIRVRLLQASKGYELGGDPYTFHGLD